MRSLFLFLLAVLTVVAAYRVPKENPEIQQILQDSVQLTESNIKSFSAPELSSSGSRILYHSSSSIQEPGDGVPKAEEPIILPPISSKEGAELALLLVPGAYINAAAYQPLGEAIQAASSLRLWVGLVRPFALDLPNPAQCGDNIELTLQMMLDQGMDNSTTAIVGGHSLGGVVMQEWIFSNIPMMSGMILMASELNGALASVPFPTLHITGDLDGMVRVPEVESVFRELEELVQTDPSSVVTKPVVILKDLNHMLFASGDPPPAVQEYDILSPVPEEEGHSLYAMHMSAFITAAVGEPQDQLEETQTILENDFVDTKEILRPLAEMRDLTVGETSSPWASVAQIIISNVDPSFSDSVVVNDTLFSDLGEFEAHQPVIEGDGEVALVNTYSRVTYPGILGIEHMLSAEELAIKLKRQEAVAEVLTPLGVLFLNSSITCRDINEAALAAALSSASDHVTERYYSRARQLLLLVDDPQDTGPQWLNSAVQYNDTEDNVIVQSTSLKTGLGVPFGFDGMNYCKLMPPSRALEYIMVDSLRGTQPVVVSKEIKTFNQKSKTLDSTIANKRQNVNAPTQQSKTLDSTPANKRLNVHTASQESKTLDSNLSNKILNVHRRTGKYLDGKSIHGQRSVDTASLSHPDMASFSDEKIQFVQPQHFKSRPDESSFNTEHGKDSAKHGSDQLKFVQNKRIDHHHNDEFGSISKTQDDKLLKAFNGLQSIILKGEGLEGFEALVREDHEENDDDDNFEHEDRTKHLNDHSKFVQNNRIYHHHTNEFESVSKTQDDIMLKSFNGLKSNILKGDGLEGIEALVRGDHEEKDDDVAWEHEEKKNEDREADNRNYNPEHRNNWFADIKTSFGDILKESDFMRSPNTLKKTEHSISERLDKTITNDQMKGAMKSGLKLLFSQGIMSHIVGKLAENTEEYMRPYFEMGTSLLKEVRDEDDSSKDRNSDHEERKTKRYHDKHSDSYEKHENEKHHERR